jgi:hypothetical protein
MLSLWSPQGTTSRQCDVQLSGEGLYQVPSVGMRLASKCSPHLCLLPDPGEAQLGSGVTCIPVCQLQSDPGLPAAPASLLGKPSGTLLTGLEDLAPQRWAVLEAWPSETLLSSSPEPQTPQILPNLRHFLQILGRGTLHNRTVVRPDGLRWD